MTPTTNDLLLNLGRTTLTLTIAVLLIGILLRLARVTAPSVHRAGCVLALAVGWSLLQWPVHVPWYEPATLGKNDASAEMAADNASENTLSTPPASDGAALATIELPHENLDAPLDDGPLDNASTADSQVGSTLIMDRQDDESASQMVDGGTPVPDGVASSLPLLVEDVLKPAEEPSIRQELTLAAVVPYTLALWGAGIVALVITWLVGYVRFVSRLPAAREAEEDWTDQWQALLVDFGIRDAVPLRVTGETGPMLCRLPRGYELLIPGPLWHELSPAERAAILRHELAHLARGDVWKSLAVRGLALPHWFNPLAWWAVRRFDEAAEWACDRAASGENSTTAYARALLRLGEAAGRHAAYSPAARGRPLAARIRRLLSTRTREDSSAKKALLLTACAGFALAALVRVELVAQEQAPVVADSGQVVPGSAAPAAVADTKGFTFFVGDNAAAKSAQPMGLAALVKDAGPGGVITIAPEELAARGLRVAIAKPADGEVLSIRGETAIGPETLVRVRPQLAGKVVEIGKSETVDGAKPQRLGFRSKVKKDQLLVTIWSNELSEKEIELVAGSATLLLDEEELTRLKSVKDRGAVAERTVREAERKVESGKIARLKIERTLLGWGIGDDEIKKLMEMAKQRQGADEKPTIPDDGLGRYTIRATSDATIVEMNVHVGDVVDSSQNLFTLADLTRLVIWAELPEEDLPRLQSSPVEARKWQLRSVAKKDQEPLDGTFTLDNLTIEPKQHMILLHGIVENRDDRLNAGEFIIATIALPPDPNIVLVPSSAFVDEANRMTVFVQDKDDPTSFQLRNVESAGRPAPARQRSIRSTPRNERGAVATEGLAAGEKVLARVNADDEANAQSAPVAEAAADSTPAAAAVNKAQEASPTRPDPDAAPATGGERAMEGVGLKTPRDRAVLDATIEGYKASLAAFKNGRGRPDSVCDWSLRMLLAEDGQEWEVQRVRRSPRGNVLERSVESAPPEARLAAARAHLHRMQELRETVAGFEKEGLTGGEPESKALIDFHVADAERRLSVATTRQAASAAAGEAIGNAQKQISDSVPDRDGSPLVAGGQPARPRYPAVVEAGRVGFERALDAYDRDTITLDEVCDWSERWLNAQQTSELIENNPAKAEMPGEDGEPGVRFPNSAEKIEFVRAHLARMKALQERIGALYKVGARGGEAEKMAMMDYYVADAERTLARLQSDVAKSRRVAEALSEVKNREARGTQLDVSGVGGVARFDDFGVQPAEKYGPAPPRTGSPAPKEQSDAQPAAPADGRTRLRYDGRTFEEWIEQLETDLSARSRKDAIGAMAAFGQRGYGAEATKILGGLLAEEELRDVTIRALGKIGPAAEEAIPQLEELADNEESRRDALQAIARIRGEKIERSNPRADLTRREIKLRELLQLKNDELVRDMHDVENLQKALGIVDPAAAAAQSQMLQQQMATLNNSIFSHTSQLANLEVEIDKHKLDIELARDPAAREARAEEEMHKDARLQKLQEQVNDLELGTAEAKSQNRGGEDNPTVKRLAKSLAATEEKIALRRDELMKRFSDSNEAIKVREYEGRQKAAEKHRDSLAEQVKELKEQQQELAQKLTVIARDTPELDIKRARVRKLQELVDELTHDLYRLQLEKVELGDPPPPRRPTEKNQSKSESQKNPATNESDAADVSEAKKATTPVPQKGDVATNRAGTAIFKPDGRVVAYLKVTPAAGVDVNGLGKPAHDFTVFRKSLQEFVHNKPLIAQVVYIPAIAELPLVHVQPDTMRWLREELQVSYPNDGELLEIGLSAKQLPDESRQVLDAVVETVMREVIEKPAQELSSRAKLLQQLIKIRSAEAAKDPDKSGAAQRSLESLQKELATVEAAQAAAPRVERVTELPKHMAALAKPVMPAEQAVPAVAPVATSGALTVTQLQEREAQLLKEVQSRHETLIGATHDLSRLQGTTGGFDLAAAAARNAALHRRLATTNRDLRLLYSDCLVLEADLEKLKAEIASRTEEAAKKARAAQVLRNDEKLGQLEEELERRTAALRDAAQPDEKEKMAVGKLSQKRDARRAELMLGTEAIDALRLKEAQGKLTMTHRKRDRMKEQIAELNRQYEDLSKQLENEAPNRGELQTKQQQVAAIQLSVDESNGQLYKISQAKQVAREQAAVALGGEAVKAQNHLKRVKLEKVLAEKSDEISRDQKEIDALRKALGVASAADVSRRTLELQQQLLQADNDIFDHTSLSSNLEAELDQLRLDIELAREPALAEGRIAEAVKSDELLRRLEWHLSDVKRSFVTARSNVPNPDDATILRFEKAIVSSEEQVAKRREEIAARFTGEGAALNVEGLQRRLSSIERHRDNIRDGLSQFRKQRIEIVKKLEALPQPATELVAKEERVQALQQLVGELRRELEKLDAEKEQAAIRK